MTRKWMAAFASCLLLASLEARAQTPPPAAAPQVNPGLINKQNQQNRQQLEDQNKLPQVPGVVSPPRTAPQVNIPGGPTFKLGTVTFDESRFLTHQELDAITAKYIGTEVDIARLQKMVQEINDLFAAKGIVTAAAYLPPQDVKNNTIYVKIVEGRLEKMSVSGASHLSPDYVLSRVGQHTGDIVDVHQVARDVAIFNKTGVARIQALLQPGGQFGLTDIELAVTEPPLDSLTFFVDNQGVSSVGSLEGGVLYQRYAPLGIDDRLTMYLVKSGGDISGNLGYNLPLGATGGRIGLSFTRGAINVIDGPYSSLDVTGDSEVFALNFSQPLFANQDWLVLLVGAVSHIDASSNQSSIPITDNHTLLETLGFNFDYADADFSAMLAPTLSFANSSADISGLHTTFLLQSGTFNAVAHLPEDFNLSVAGAWQFSNKDPLPGDQLFQLGGPTTIRGYSTDVVAGPTGYYANFELHHTLPIFDNSVDGFAFFDHGSVYNSFPSVQTLNSLGMGFTWSATKYLSAEMSAGFPLDTVVNTQSDYEIYFRVNLRVDD